MSEQIEHPPSIEQSAKVAELIKAMVIASAAVEHPRRNAANPHFKSRYADLTAVIDSYRSAYLEAGLVVTQMPMAGSLVTMVCHTSGQYIRYSSPIKPDRAGVQAFGSALTYMRRYTLQALTGIAADDDDDGTAATTAPSAPVDPIPNAEQMKALARISTAKTVAELDDLRPCLETLVGKARKNARLAYGAKKEELLAQSREASTDNNQEQAEK